MGKVAAKATKYVATSKEPSSKQSSKADNKKEDKPSEKSSEANNKKEDKSSEKSSETNNKKEDQNEAQLIDEKKKEAKYQEPHTTSLLPRLRPRPPVSTTHAATTGCSEESSAVEADP